jgi:murein DD-endopeptidase MepM/ murein hydrolase activator NlpD
VKALAVFSAPVLAVVLVLFAVVVVMAPVKPSPVIAAAASTCVPEAGGSGADEVRLDREQWQVARDVIGVGKGLGVAPRGWVVALAAGMQESGLRPLPYGDRDSLGVFQQRAAWGNAAQRLNPVSAARMFFTGGHGGQRGLLDIAAWQSMPVTKAAQAVQVSAYPDAYAKWESLAVRIVEQLAHVDGSCQPTGDWVFPLGRAGYVLTAGFGECGGHWSHCHTGQDFAVPTGTPVVTAGAGTVTYAGWAGAYGNAVHVLHADGIATWYCHLSRIRTRRGAGVGAGDLIGLSGSTGNTTGPHLHFEVRTNATTSADGAPIDPLPWLHSHHVL